MPLLTRPPRLPTVARGMTKAKTESLIQIERVAGRIYLIRGMKVMVDFDLAELYAVETRFR